MTTQTPTQRHNTMLDQGAIGKTESEMSEEFGKLIGAISSTTELATTLGQRLHSVLRPSTPTPEVRDKMPPNVRPLLSPLAEAINQKKEELVSVNGILSDLLHRLAL